MKILHVIASVFKNGGGTSEVVPRMCEALVAAGHEVRLVTGEYASPSDAAVQAQKNGVDIRYMPMRAIPHLGFLCVTSSFRRAIEEGVAWADVVHVHCLWQDPVWVASRLARKYNKPYVMQPHGLLEPERLKISVVQKKLVGRLIERSNLNHADALIATADSEQRGIEAYGVNAPIRVVPIGIDTASIDAARYDATVLGRLGLDAEKRTVLYFSRLTPIKGLDLLAKAWVKLSDLHGDWQLCIAGPDDRGYAAVIQSEFAQQITDGSVKFVGPVYGPDKYALLKSVDGFVLPTRSENFSIAVQEALAAGLPVVCTKGAPWEVVEREGAGYWVDIDVDAIAAALRCLMTVNDDARLKMAKAGKSLVARDFNWNVISSHLSDIYCWVLKGRGNGTR